MKTTSMKQEILDRSSTVQTAQAPRQDRRVQRAFFLTVAAF